MCRVERGAGGEHGASDGEQRDGDDGIAEHVTPLREAAVGGEDHRALLVTGVDQLEEHVGAAGGDRQVADLVDDEQARPGQEADLVAEATLAFGAAEGVDELGERAAVDALASIDRGDAETSRASVEPRTGFTTDDATRQRF